MHTVPYPVWLHVVYYSTCGQRMGTVLAVIKLQVTQGAAGPPMRAAESTMEVARAAVIGCGTQQLRTGGACCVDGDRVAVGWHAGSGT